MPRKYLRTPFLDELELRKKMFMAPTDKMPTPSEFDLHFLEVAEKHGHDLFEDDESDYENNIDEE